MNRPLTTLGCLTLAAGALFGCSDGAGSGSSTTEPTSAWVDSQVCAECHAAEAEAWSGSHHDLAMQPANAATVLGDFNDAVFEQDGVETRFFLRDGKPFVHTQGEGGGSRDFEILYTFGVEPLQQYLVELEHGRVQCLTVAWDTEAERWFSLYPDDTFAPDDALHWTGRYQRWNAMCAECHSTALEKAYDPSTDGYETTWHEIDVGCQACHGPGGDHVAWARGGGPAAGTDPSLAVTLKRGGQAGQLNTCAPCHSRRTQLVENPEPGAPFLDNYLPERLRAGFYHADGQILDEVYVYGSFMQSKMGHLGVTCTDCHEPHGAGLWLEGDALCLQCHSTNAPQDRFPTLQVKRYDTPEHHHHPVDSEGARCVNCHMAERTYMVVDPRRDHGFRLPRPDLTIDLGTPNACNGCHTDQTPEWAAEAITDWTGTAERPQHFGFALTLGQIGHPLAERALAQVASDPNQAGIVRATALELFNPTQPESIEVLVRATQDEDALVRASAARTIAGLPMQARASALIPLIEDPVRSVRIEAARGLVELPTESLPETMRATIEAGLAEYVTAQQVGADLPGSHLNLGVLYADQNRGLDAEREYRTALEFDQFFLPARFNLATLLNQRGRNADGIEVLREGLKQAPDNGELHYSLGLALAEDEHWSEAADSLGRAADLMPDRPRIRYNHGLALQRAGRLEDAVLALGHATRQAPEDAEAMHALALLHIELEQWEAAVVAARRVIEVAGEAEWSLELLRQAENGLSGDG